VAKEWMADKLVALESRMPTSKEMADAITAEVTKAVVAQISSIAAANSASARMSQSQVRSAMAVAVQVSLLRGAYKVGVVRLLKRLHVAKSEDCITPNFPPTRRLANRWVREHFEHVVHGTVLRCYKAHQVLTVVPDILKEKTTFAVDSQDDVDKAMVALVYNHLADGRAATRAHFYNEFGFFLVHEDTTVRIRMMHLEAEEPLAAEAAGSDFFAYKTWRVVSPAGVVVPAASAAAAAEGAAPVGGRVLTEEGCLYDQADTMLQCLTRCNSTTEPIALKIFALSLRRAIMSDSPMWKSLLHRDITADSVGPRQWHLLMPRLSTRARLDAVLRTMTEDMTAALPPLDAEALMSDSEEEEGVLAAPNNGAPPAEGPEDW